MSNRTLSPSAKELIRAKAMISDPDNWCQGRMEHGSKHCAAGALGCLDADVGCRVSIPPSLLALSKSCRDVFPIASYQASSTIECITYVNDCLGHEAILKCFDHAINQTIRESNP